MSPGRVSNLRMTAARAVAAFASACLMVVLSPLALAQTADYYVAPDGNDDHPGSQSQPFATWEQAQSVATPGDLIYFRGGTYPRSSEVRLTKSGTPDARIRYHAYPGETPVFDFQNVPPGEDGIVHQADWLHVKGFEVKNVPASVSPWSGYGYSLRSSPSESASNNIVEQIRSHHNGLTGIRIASGPSLPSNNLILNSDSYFNFSGTGGDSDGFAAHQGIGPGNEFRGCRAWNNSDDGWDFWDAGAPVRLVGNWAYRNGIDSWNVAGFSGDGNGFKLGRDGTGAPHVVIDNMAFDNAHTGFAYNDNLSVITVTHNTAYANGGSSYWFNGAPHVLRNNIAGGSVPVGGPVDDQFNSWNDPPGVSVAAADFVSVDTALADLPRQSDGALPAIDLFRLTPSSNLRGAGENGADLGARHPADVVEPAPPTDLEAE